MTRDQQIADIRAACIRANPNKAWFYIPRMSKKAEVIPVRLSDVLLAIWKSGNIGEFSQEVVMGAREPRRLIEIWNLYKDDLSEQTDGVLDLIVGAFTG